MNISAHSSIVAPITRTSRALGNSSVLLTGLALMFSGCVSGLLPMHSTALPPGVAAATPPAPVDQMRAQCLTRVNESARLNNTQRTQTYVIGFVAGGVSSILAGLSASAATPDAQMALGPAAVYVPAGIGAGLGLVLPVLVSSARADTLTREYTTLSNELDQSDDLATSGEQSDAHRREALIQRCAQGHVGFTAHVTPTR